MLLYSVLSFVLSVGAVPPASQPTEESGTLKVRYAQKYCFTTPCPQFDILEVNGKALVAGADLVNVDAESSAISSFQNVLVKGHWTREGRYYRVTVSEWKAVIKEKVPAARTSE